MRKRSVKICAGDKPLRSNIFVKTKVLPQMATTIKATKWYSMLPLNLNVAVYIIANLLQIALHSLRILIVNDFQQLLQLCTNL